MPGSPYPHCVKDLEKCPLCLSPPISSSKDLYFSLAYACFVSKANTTSGGASINPVKKELKGIPHTYGTTAWSWHAPLGSSSTNCPGYPLPGSGGVQQLGQRAASEPPPLICTAPFSHMVTFASSSITWYNENTGICFAATLVFQECLDIYVPPRDIMLCQDFILVALSTPIKDVPTCFSHVAK